MSNKYLSDIATIDGNVTFQVKNTSNTITKEFIKHNSISNEGIFNILQTLCYEGYQSTISGIRFWYTKDNLSYTSNIFNEFSSKQIINGSNSPYLELKFYLSSDSSLDGVTRLASGEEETLTRVELMTTDSAGIQKVFADVSIGDTIDGTNPVQYVIGTSEDQTTLIKKTLDNSLIIIWRISLTSVFKTIIF